MAYSLQFDGSDEHVDLPDITAAQMSGDFSFEFEIRYVAHNGYTFFVSAWPGDSFRWYIGTQDNEFRIFHGDFSYNGDELVDDTVYTIKLDVVGTATTLSLDGVEKFTTNTPGGFELVRRFGASLDSAYNTPSELRWMSFVNGTDDRYYDPNATGGTGLVLEDTTGGEDGTLVNFPSDDSQWVSYSDGGVVMTISESATAADIESAQANLLSTISESASASDTATGKLSASLSVSESAGASDTDTGQYATSQEIIEAVQASDLAGTLLKSILTQNLSALASDTVSLKANYGLTLSESAGATDTDTGKASLIATLSESATGSDSVSMPTDGVVTLNIGEVSTASDGVSMSASFSMTLSESAQASDSIASRATLLATIAEALSASDTFGGFSPSVYTLTIGEAVTALDSVSASLAGLRGLITATITIEPMITGAATTEPTITGAATTEPTITGTITVS